MIESITDFFFSLIPQNPLFFLLYLFLFLVFGSLFIYVFARKKDTSSESKKELTMNDLLKIASNSKSTTADLLSALQLFNKHFSFKEKEAFKFIEKVLNHKNRKKILFNYFHNSIVPIHSKYKKKLEDIERKALNNK